MHNLINRFLLVLFSFFSSEIYSQAIVDIEQIRKNGEIGIFKSANLFLANSSGNEDRSDIKLGFNYVNNSDKNEFMMTINKSERKKDEAIEDEAFFTHIRYLKKLSNKNFDIEGYIQRSENPFQSYSMRDIAGIGLRFKIFEDSRFGISLLDEKEESLLGIKTNTTRLNFYLSKPLVIAENDLNVSLFYQPKVNSFSEDYKTSLVATYKIEISELFNIKINYSNSLDSMPPDNAGKRDSSISTSFEYKF